MLALPSQEPPNIPLQVTADSYNAMLTALAIAYNQLASPIADETVFDLQHGEFIGPQTGENRETNNSPVAHELLLTSCDPQGADILGFAE